MQETAHLKHHIETHIPSDYDSNNDTISQTKFNAKYIQVRSTNNPGNTPNTRVKSKNMIICIGAVLVLAILVVLGVYFNPFTELKSIPSDFATQNTQCNELTNCGSCALNDRCSWCGSCMPIEQNQDCIIDTPGCDKYAPTTQVKFEANEKLDYQLRFKSCMRNPTATNIAQCQQQEAGLSFYVETADNVHRSYHILAKISSMVVDNHINILRDFDHDLLPFCDIYIRTAMVTNMSCGNWSDQLNNIQTNANKFQSDIILTALHELLPRLDNMLYEDDNENFTEIVSNGDVHMHRFHTTSGNRVELNESYELTDFQKWMSGIMPTNIVFNEQRIVNTDNNHLENTHKHITVELESFNDIYTQEVDTELILISRTVSMWDFEKMKKNVYDYRNGYYSLYFTLEQWRAESSQFSNRMNEIQTFRDDLSDSSYVLGRGHRRRLSDSGDTVQLFDHRQQLVSASVLGVSIEIEALVEVDTTPAWQWDQKSNVSFEANGCSLLGDDIAEATNFYEEITQCCNVHDADYANCDSKQSEADEKLIECVKRYDENAAALFRIGLREIPVVSSVFYYAAKFKHCSLSSASVTDMIDIMSRINIKMNGNIVYEMLFMEDAYIEGHTVESHPANFGIFGGCIGLGLGDLCFDLYATVMFDLEVDLTITDNQSYSLTAVPRLSAGITADASFALVLVQVGGRIRGDILQASIPATAEVQYGSTPVIKADLVLETAVLTIDAYYQYLECDCGCWCLCATCWWSGKHSVYEWSETFGDAQVYPLLDWKIQ